MFEQIMLKGSEMAKNYVRVHVMRRISHRGARHSRRCTDDIDVAILPALSRLLCSSPPHLLLSLTITFHPRTIVRHVLLRQEAPCGLL